MCEITCENFYSLLPIIEEAIKESAFIGLDMEFSNLQQNVTNPFTFFDTSEERYNKLRLKVSDITCIQLGLAIFTYDTNKKTFKSCTYSFYTYPQTFYKSDTTVHFQTSCVEFLCKHKFDFNKLFYTRIPYLTDEQEMTIKLDMLDTSFFDKYFVTNFKFRSIEEELNKILNIVSEWYENADYGDQTFLEINGCNEPAYIIIMQYYLLKTFKYISIDESQFGLTVTKIKENEDSEKTNNEFNEHLKICLFHKMMGIKHLMKLISKMKKPLVGHNCTLDILVLSNQFFKPLPEKFEDYQRFVSHNFGPIYDTKLLYKEVKRILSKNGVRNESSLSEMYLFFKDGDGKIYSDTMCLFSINLTGIEEPQDMKLHHAGWDAYYTGYCFIKIIHLIKKFSSKTEIINEKYTLTEVLKSVEFYKNKLYTSRSLTNSLDLKEDNHHKVQTNFLIIQNKGIFLTVLDLKKLKSDVRQNCNFDIKLLSNYTALIVPSSLNKRIISNLKLKYNVENYSDYQSRKKTKYIVGLSLIIITTTITVLKYIKK